MAEVCTPHKLLEPATLMEMPVLTASWKWLTVPVQSGSVIGSFSHRQSEVALIHRLHKRTNSGKSSTDIEQSVRWFGLSFSGLCLDHPVLTKNKNVLMSSPLQEASFLSEPSTTS